MCENKSTPLPTIKKPTPLPVIFFTHSNLFLHNIHSLQV